jgi:hypothetical protein
MLDFNILAEFSRNNCLGICYFLVPANILTTLLTLIFTVTCRPTYRVRQIAVIASIFAAVMVLHVYTWFSIGIVMMPTYILLSLAITCLVTNLGAVLWQKRYGNHQSQDLRVMS